MNKAADLIVELEKLGVTLWEEDGLLKVSAPKDVLSVEIRTEISTVKDQLLEMVKAKALASIEKTIYTISVAERKDLDVPLSFSQKRIWYLNELEGGNAITYNMPAALLFKVKGDFNEDQFLQSLNLIVKRHEVLRTSFRQSGEQVYQHIKPFATLDKNVISIEHLSAIEQDIALQKMIDEEARLPFNLSTDRLMRYRLIRLRNGRYAFLFTLHHIISDGWSIAIFIKELITSYTALTGGTQISLPDLPIQYADFAIWQKKWLSGKILENLLMYWKRELEGIPALISLPTDRPRPAVQSFNGDLEKYDFGPELSDGLKRLCHEQNVTPFMALISVYAVLLSRWCGQDDIVIGSVIANRNRKEIENLIGFFVNSLVFRVKLNTHLTFTELLAQVRRTSLDAFDHQDLPFEKLVEEIKPERTLSHSPIFQVAFALQNAGNDELTLPGLEINDLNTHTGTSKYDITFFAGESTNSIAGVVEYNSAIFNRETIQRFITHFRVLLSEVIQSPKSKVSEINLLDPAEKQIILKKFCGNTDNNLADQTILDVFEENVKRYPHSIALCYGKDQITYYDLHHRSNQLAFYLIKKGLSKSEKVGVMSGRYADQVIGLLAVLKAGGCYLPLDPDYPMERLKFIMEDSETSMILVHSQYVDILSDGPFERITIDKNRDAGEGSGLDKNIVKIATSDPAYMIYTSGSTGVPKGVILNHGGLMNLVKQQIHTFKVTANSRVLQFASPGFDASISEYFMALGIGACLVMTPKENLLPLPQFNSFLTDKRISHVTLSPSFLALLPYIPLPYLTHLITAGEACTLALVKKWAAGRNFYNAYGPTESTVCTTIALCHPDIDSITIGRPMANILVYVLDNNCNLCPIGVSGELYIGGRGLALGYYNRPELNTDKFILLSIDHGPEVRLYRSGDRGRFLADGQIEFLGRMDDQVKIRGFRIEPGEIESVLRSHALVKDAVVVVNESEIGDKQLFSYICPETNWEHKFSESTEHEIIHEQVTHWQEIFDDSYSQNLPKPKDLTFNIAGWNSSYTGRPIPETEMVQWVDDTVERIVSYQPKHVLEIGCGSGLLLFRIASKCESYLGTDFSANVIEALVPVLAQKGLTNVDVKQCNAIDIADSIDRQFDMIILNSVVQYFPNQEYLLAVLKAGLKLLTPGGHFFIGDVRNNLLHETFQASIVMFKSNGQGNARQLLQLIEQNIKYEEELLVDPQFFGTLPKYISTISGIKTLWKKGRYSNELNKFRYDVIFEKEGISTIEMPFEMNWSIDKPSALQVLAKLTAFPSIPVLLKGVKNGRVLKDVKLLDKLELARDSDDETLCLDLADLEAIEGLNPADFFELESFSSYRIEIWCSATDKSSFDVLFSPFNNGVPKFYQYDQHMHTNLQLNTYTNYPGKGQFLQKLVPALKQFLADRLPDYMVPALFEVMDSFPVTPNGKVDRTLLSKKSNRIMIRGVANYEAPTTPDQLQLLSIWQLLLSITSIGIHDNFFDIGGHSLLAVQLINRINAVYSSEMTLVDLFANPNIASQALFLMGKSKHKRNEILVKFSHAEKDEPLFFIPGAGGNALQLTDMGKAFQNVRTFYALQVNEPPDVGVLSGVEAIAKQNLIEIKRIQKKGPYYLGGHSFGGLVAYEMARQLELMGEKVNFLGILDCAPPQVNATILGQDWSDTKWLLEFANLNGLLANIKEDVLQQLTQEQQLVYVKEILENGNILEEAKNLDKTIKLAGILRTTLGTKYNPSEEILNAKIHLFMASDNDNYSESESDWKGFASDVRIINATGNHFTMLKHPHVNGLVTRIVSIIKAINK